MKFPCNNEFDDSVRQISDHPNWRASPNAICDLPSKPPDTDFEQWRFDQAVKRELSGDD
jgi:hypothetical protein